MLYSVSTMQFLVRKLSPFCALAALASIHASAPTASEYMPPRSDQDAAPIRFSRQRFSGAANGLLRRIFAA
jgi:hypothetical protein